MNIQSFRKKVVIGIGIVVLSFSGCASQTSKSELEETVQNEVVSPKTEEDTTLNLESNEAGENNKKGEESSKIEESTKPEEVNDLAINGEGLKNLYEENFPIGVALPRQAFKHMSEYEEVILNNFNSITCENEMKPESLLDKEACQSDLENTYENPVVKFDACDLAVQYAVEHDIKIRLHTLVWHSQTPKWFFTEDYTDEGTLVSREVMLKRMEHYIAAVLNHFKEQYPGLIYAVDVVNEAFDKGDGDETGVRKKNNLWYETVGNDYYYQAFVFARKYADQDMKLFYNDYACVWKPDMILEHLQKAKDEGLIDGIGMQSHLSIDDDVTYKFMATVKTFCKAGYEVQATELDIGTNKDGSEEKLMKQARKYKAFFSNMKKLQEEGYNITGITVWGLNDEMSWRRGEHALLFDGKMNAKKAYEGAMLMENIPPVE